MRPGAGHWRRSCVAGSRCATVASRVTRAGDAPQMMKTIKRNTDADSEHLGMEISAAATDTFVGFVDGLTQALGTDALSIDDAASRAYLSRSHFDRVIRAVAGEP